MSLDEHELELIEELSEDPLVIDGGMGRGEWTAAVLAKHPFATVVGAEPNPRNYEVCRYRFRNYDRLHLAPVALGETEIIRPLHVDPSGLGSSLGRSQMNCVKWEPLPVQVMRIESLLEFGYWGTVDLLKLDVEGWEFPAIRGMGDLRPRIIQFERGETWREAGENLEECCDYLERIGYRIRRDWQDENNVVADYIASARSSSHPSSPEPSSSSS